MTEKQETETTEFPYLRSRCRDTHDPQESQHSTPVPTESTKTTNTANVKMFLVSIAIAFVMVVLSIHRFNNSPVVLESMDDSDDSGMNEFGEWTRSMLGEFGKTRLPVPAALERQRASFHNLAVILRTSDVVAKSGETISKSLLDLSGKVLSAVVTLDDMYLEGNSFFKIIELEVSQMIDDIESSNGAPSQEQMTNMKAGLQELVRSLKSFSKKVTMAIGAVRDSENLRQEVHRNLLDGSKEANAAADNYYHRLVAGEIVYNDNERSQARKEAMLIGQMIKIIENAGSNLVQLQGVLEKYRLRLEKVDEWLQYNQRRVSINKRALDGLKSVVEDATLVHRKFMENQAIDSSNAFSSVPNAPPDEKSRSPVYKGELYGRSVGSEFFRSFAEPPFAAVNKNHDFNKDRLVRVGVTVDDRIQAMFTVWGSNWCSIVGNGGGCDGCHVDLDAEERITTLVVSASEHVHGLEFRTSKGRSSGWCGSKPLNVNIITLTAPVGSHIVGIHGTFDNGLSSIGLMLHRVSTV